MRIILLHNHYDEAHLQDVVEQMETLGAPTIRVYNLGFDNLYQAVEGCHRLRACEALEIEPIIEIVAQTETVGSLGLDFDADPDTAIAEIGDWENYSIDI